jgi:hypothetical protein
MRAKDYSVFCLNQFQLGNPSAPISHMGKAGGPMNFGFNSNVRVGSATYHVQTEDRGPSHPFLDTVVYMAGRVVYKRSTSYEKFASGVEAETLAKKLHERLAQQHREVITELEAGMLPVDGRKKAAPAAASASKSADTQEGIELRLTNPKSWFVAGNVILEIELHEKNSEQPVGDADIEACLEHGERRIPCVDASTDANGCATLKFAMPENVADGSSLVVRAAEGDRRAELRFRLKSKPVDKSPAPVSR